MTTSRCPDREAHGVTLSPTPCGLSDTGLVLLVRCPPLTAWPRGHPRSAVQVLVLLACLPLCCLWCWCARGAGVLEVLWEDKRTRPGPRAWEICRRCSKQSKFCGPRPRVRLLQAPRRAHVTQWRRRGPTARGASVEDLRIRAICRLQAAPP